MQIDSRTAGRFLIRSRQAATLGSPSNEEDKGLAINALKGLHVGVGILAEQILTTVQPTFKDGEIALILAFVALERIILPLRRVVDEVAELAAHGS